MPSVTELYNLHAGKDIYIIGTGASFRVFPPSFFEGKITIGLNLAWDLIPVDYAITMVPNLNFPEFLEKERPKNTLWITKQDKYDPYATSAQKEFADKAYYFFKTNGQFSFTALDEPSEAGRVLDWIGQPSEDYLYLWTSISQTAVNLAANMGAKNVILVGCDNCALANNHHAQNQHTLWKGADPDDRYMQYYQGLREVRSALRQRGVNLLSLTPFLKLDDPEMDFNNLCDEYNKPQFIENHDIYKGVSIGDYNKRFLLMMRELIKHNYLYLRKRLFK